MSTILNFANWKRLYEERGEAGWRTMYDPAFPKALVDEIISSVKQNEYSTGGWFTVKSNPNFMLHLYSKDPEQEGQLINQNGKVYTVKSSIIEREKGTNAVGKNPYFSDLTFNLFRPYIDTNNPMRSQYLSGGELRISGLLPDIEPLDTHIKNFKPTGSSLEGVKIQFSEVNPNANGDLVSTAFYTDSLKSDPNFVSYFQKLYSFLSPVLKEHFKIQMQNVANKKVPDFTPEDIAIAQKILPSLA